MDLSGFVLESDDGSALKHERLRDYLLAELRSGRLLPGQALPSEPDLVRRLGISRNTIRQAFGELEESGLIRRVRGKGTFVSKEAAPADTKSLRVFALVLPELRGGYYPSIIRTFEEVAGDLNFQVMTCNSSNDIRKQGDIVLQLIDKQVAGVALVPATTPATPPHQVIQLQKHGIPVVFCHRCVEGVSAPLLALPFFEVGRRAGTALLEQGHRRVAYMDSFRDKSGEAFESGLRWALESAGESLPDQLVCYGSGTSPDPAVHEKEALAQLKTLLALPSPPTAIATGFTSFSEMVYMLLGDLGKRLPDDISLISFGGKWREGAASRRLTTITVDESATARRAVQLLDEMCNGKRPMDDNEDFSIPLSLYEGHTLGKPGVPKQLAS
ncbi:MAG: GntR family transcriptional regulator [Pirellulales bacterium]|nr:GntR family transcriptional regulator [Pirellulales bacterium]